MCQMHSWLGKAVDTWVCQSPVATFTVDSVDSVDKLETAVTAGWATLLVELWWNPSESFRFVNVRCVMSAAWPFENAEFRQVEFHKFWHKWSQVKSSEVKWISVVFSACPLLLVTFYAFAILFRACNIFVWGRRTRASNKKAESVAGPEPLWDWDLSICPSICLVPPAFSQIASWGWRQPQGPWGPNSGGQTICVKFVKSSDKAERSESKSAVLTVLTL